jgi:GMP synthase (glutamine-hydrolysing)
MNDRLRYLLLQVRNPDDPMRGHEVRSFCRALAAQPEQISVFDLLSGRLPPERLADCDVVLLGGSGHYSVTEEGPWLERALESMRAVHASGTPTFASCWGFQAMARAMGGRVVKDLAHAEVGTHWLKLTDAGRDDPLFGPLGDEFQGQMGHEDHVIELPPGATLLASSGLVKNQAYRFDDRPIYCTQFHPELNCADLMLRVQTYPEYVERIAGLPSERFPELLSETPQTEQLLKRFVQLVFAERGEG